MLGKYFGKPQRAADKWLLFLSIDFFSSWTEVQRVNLLLVASNKRTLCPVNYYGVRECVFANST